MLIGRRAGRLRSRLLVAGAVVAALTGSALTPTSASASTTPVAVHSGWFGLWSYGANADGSAACLDSDSAGSAYILPCQVPGNKYQDWNWTEWQAYSPYSGYYYFYSIEDQATGRCLDSNAVGQVYTSPCQAPGNTYQDWYSPGFTTGYTTFKDMNTGRLLFGSYNGNSYSLTTENGTGSADQWSAIQ